MSSINASEYVLLDCNAENATMTPLQTTPSLTPSESLSPALLPVLTSTPTPHTTTITTSNATTQSSSPSTRLQSYESFTQDLELKRVEWHLEARVLALCTDDGMGELRNTEKARSIVEKLYPSQNASSIFYIRLSKYLLKHSRADVALTALDQFPTGANGKELPGVLEKDDRVTYWYYKALSILEIQKISENSGVEDAVKNGMIEAVGCVDPEIRKKWINVGYFLMSVYSLLKNDEIDARFWKNQLPAGYTLPDGIHSSHLQLFNNLTLAQLTTNSAMQSTDLTKDLSQLEGLEPTDLLMKDVARLKRDMNEIYDTVYMNYKEMNERIKSIHGILDGRENVGGEDLKEVKRRIGYLEGMVLRG
ncbi:hypothetical protein TWF106_007389 [Orbilia oligospora]|uniref:Uncharacterized protein n=1 Tax=Orbilia oligospora TaxID=2813651 RepID=A0A7C8UZH4_ORBOL|nr:hypothetical protein TWF788_002745 [Orbilia oligospora]KAF3228357.1 hypothetical protein TWF106_007389 [Orbilia oligospora]KAF3228562.1 hypothetical protein TWF191_002418 [Orbilia oligospora]